jgi:hypothetical protein
MLLMVSGALPVLVSVTARNALVVPRIWLPKDNEVGVRLTAGAVPVPVSPTECGLPVALSFTVRVAERAPVAFGVNVTEIVQLAPAASVAGLSGQVEVWA